MSYAIELDSVNPGAKRSVEREAKAARRTDTSLTHWTIRQEEARKGLHPSKWTGSLAQHWDPYVNVEGGYGHGNVTHMGKDVEVAANRHGNNHRYSY